MKVQLVITVEDTGQVSVSGPIDQLMWCLGLLEIAKKQLFDHDTQKKQRVLQPTAADLAKLRD